MSSSSLLIHFIILFSVFEYVTCVNCRQDKDTGVNCNNQPITLKFYFDVRTNVCQPLFYRGCAGNENRFESREACSEACVPKNLKKSKKDGKVKEENEEESEEEEEDQVENKDMSLVVNMCKLPTDAKIAAKVQKCDNGCPTGYRCTKKNFCCPSKEHLCALPVSSGAERLAFKHYGRYAYQPGLHNCIRFSYFGQDGNYNNFLTYNACKKFCMHNE
ncbi:unnamed protein product [Caenorhabditis sp. 36 PRJEB53466]|nr:unnamed protein product [Caenorhabditis sp. 36 PRJEB53466]